MSDEGAKSGRKAAGVKRRIRELMDRGMSSELAHRVASGALPESEALEQMARASEARFLMGRHGLDKALAMQIAHGHADLERTLATRRFQAHREAHRHHSVFAEAVASGAPWWFLRIDGRGEEVVVQADRTYEIDVERAKDGSVHTWPKLEIVLAAAPADARRVQRALKRVDDGGSRPPEGQRPEAQPQARYRLGDRRLHRYIDEEATVEATLQTGQRIRGTVRWFARYEFALGLRHDVEIRVLRHALTRLGSVPERSNGTP